MSLMRGKPTRGDDAGFGMVEAVVSLAIMAVVLTSLGVVLLGTTRATVTARADQQASNILNQQIEEIRSFDFAAVTLRSTDTTLASDPAVSVDLAASPPSGTLLSNGEPLVIDSVGSVEHQLPTIRRNNTDFQVRRYVSQPSDSSGDVQAGAGRRQWNIAGRARERRIDTYVSDTRRGMPLPKFVVGLNGTSTPKDVGAGDAVVWGLKSCRTWAHETRGTSQRQPGRGRSTATSTATGARPGRAGRLEPAHRHRQRQRRSARHGTPGDEQPVLRARLPPARSQRSDAAGGEFRFTSAAQSAASPRPCPP